MPVSSQAAPLNQRPLLGFPAFFATLQAPRLDQLQGVYRAEFVGPSWLRRIAPPGLALGGMAGWWGKIFEDSNRGHNIVRRQGEMKAVVPVRLQLLSSRIDGRPCLQVAYPGDSPFPWPWVIDELRVLDNACLLGMTLVPSGLLKRLALPFLLHETGHHSLADLIVSAP